MMVVMMQMMIIIAINIHDGDRDVTDDDRDDAW